MESYNVFVAKSINRQEITDFLAKIFESYNKNARRVFDTMFDYEPSLSAENFIIARNSQGALIGLVRIVDRQILIGGTLLNVGGISSVSVLPEWRQKGVCSLLMKKAHVLMKERGKDIAVLYGRRAMDGFYTRYGYYGIGLYIDLEVNVPQCGRGKLRSVSFKETKEQVQSVMKFYKKEYYPLSGSIIRSPRIWEYLFAQIKESSGKLKLFLFFDGNRPAGYCLIREDKIIELSLLEKYYADFLGVLKFLKIGVLSIHPRHPFLKYCRSRISITIFKERFALNGGYMARLINQDSFISKLGLTLVPKAGKLGLGNKTLNVLGHKIFFRDGKVRITKEESDIYFSNKSLALRVLLGVSPLSSAWDIRWNSEKPWIPHLWNGGDFHTCAWDEI